MLAISRTYVGRNVPLIPSRLIRGWPQYHPAALPAAATTLRRLFSTPSSEHQSDPPQPQSLAGTVPHCNAYVLLHTHRPPLEYPGRSKSRLWRTLTLKARKWGGVVNFSWSPSQSVHPAYTGLGEAGDEGEEAYTASAFSVTHRGRIHVPEITLANLDAVDARLSAHCHRSPDEDLDTSVGPSADVNANVERDDSAAVISTDEGDAEKLFLYVCTHGSRDCRCGDTGGEVARALRAEIAKRGVEDDVFLGEVAHVGGHKYAANVLVFPYGDMLGTVQEFDVLRILDEALGWHTSHRRARSTADLAPLCPPFWRGRMGLTKDEQLALISKPPL